MSETQRENGKVSSQGSLLRKPWPLGSSACLQKSLFLGKFAGFVSPLQREEKPQDMGDSRGSFFKDKFVCLQQETPRLWSFTKGGDWEADCVLLWEPSPQVVGRGRWFKEWVSYPCAFPSFRFTSTTVVSQKRKSPMSTVLERNFESSNYYTSCHRMTMR